MTAPDAAPVSVLYIDDDPDYAELARVALEDQRDAFEVEVETSARAGLERTADEDIDCVVSDYSMAEMDGLELLEAVRERRPDLPFILVTGQGSEHIASEAISAGVTDYLAKYANDDTHAILANRIENAVDGYRAERARRESERALSEERALIDQALDTLDDAFYVVDTDGEFRRWNDRLADVTGYTDDELAEMAVGELFPETERDRVLEALEAGRGAVEVDLLTADGDRIPYEFTAARLTDADDDPWGVVGIGRDISGRVERERRLATLHQVTRRLFQATSREEVAETAVSAAKEILGLPVTGAYTVIGPEERFSSLARTPEVDELFDGPVGRLDEDAVREVFETGERSIRTDIRTWPGFEESPIRGELLLPLGSHGVLVAGSATRSEFDETERSLATVLATNVTAALDRTEREQAVTKLHDTTDDLLGARTAEDVGRLVVDAAYTVLHLDSIAVYLFDDDAGVLRPTATSPDVAELVGEPPPVGPDEGAVWEVFAEGHATVADAAASVFGPEAPLESALVIPLGDSGVFLAGSTRPDAFDERTVELAELLATNAEAAIDRTHREQQLRDREQRLEQQTTELGNLNRLNELLRDVNQALVRTETREDIETTICERLVDNEFALAWVATTDRAGDQLVARAWDGPEGGYLDAISMEVGEPPDREPTVEAAATGEITVVDDISTDFRSQEWRKQALTHGFQSMVSVPLVYEDASFGVLSVYTDDSSVFDDVPDGVLRELGETIAYAINAAERKQAFLSGATVELEFEVTDPNCTVLQLARGADCSLSFESVVPQSDGSAVAYATVDEGDHEDVLALEAESVLVESARLVGDVTETPRVELGLSTRPIETTLADYGAVPRQVTADQEAARFVVDVPDSTDVNAVMDVVANTYPDVELLARRERDRSGETGGAPDVSAPLTERQREVLQAAYYAGYFNWPRDSTAEEVADSLGIASSTVHHHLREAQRKLFASVVEEETASSQTTG